MFWYFETEGFGSNCWGFPNVSLFRNLCRRCVWGTGTDELIGVQFWNAGSVVLSAVTVSSSPVDAVKFGWCSLNIELAVHRSCWIATYFEREQWIVWILVPSSIFDKNRMDIFRIFEVQVACLDGRESSSPRYRGGKDSRTSSTFLENFENSKILLVIRIISWSLEACLLRTAVLLP